MKCSVLIGCFVLCIAMNLVGETSHVLPAGT